MSTMTTTANAEPAAKPRSPLRSSLVLGLIALLALQLAVAFLLGTGGKTLGPTEPEEPLLALDPEQVTGIRIQTPDKTPVVIAKGADGWTLPALQDLPADEHKVTGLLAKLQNLRKGLPVATSEGALERFRVADQAFERKLQLERDDAPPLTLYLGDSPGFQRLFVRAHGDGAVYEAKLGHFDAPDRPDDWSDRTLLHLDPQDIQTLTFAGLTLQRTDDDWRLADLTAGEHQDQEAIQDRVRRLTSIGFLDVLTDEETPAVDTEADPVEIQATLSDGETIDYRIAKLAEGDDYLLQASNHPQAFKITSYLIKGLTGVQRADLLKKPEATQDDPPPDQTETGEDPEPAAEAATTPSDQTQESP